jgi:hypothetical protein
LIRALPFDLLPTLKAGFTSALRAMQKLTRHVANFLQRFARFSSRSQMRFLKKLKHVSPPFESLVTAPLHWTIAECPAVVGLSPQGA